MKKIITALFAVGAVCLYAAEKGVLLDYTFSKNPGIKLHSNAKIEDNLLKMDGKSYATVPNSKNWHLTEKGLTMIITAKLKEYGSMIPGKPTCHDMFFAKGREFIFGRSDKQLYVNFHDGKQWAATTIGSAPVVGEWAQYAATIEHYSDRAQGDEGFIVRIFLNGELEVAKRFPWTKPEKVTDNVLIGSGFGGGTWLLNGEIAMAKMYERAFSEAEIAAEFAKEKRVKKVRKGFTEVQPSLKKSLDALQKSASVEGKWLAAAFQRAATNGLDQKKLQSAIPAIQNAAKASSMKNFAKAFNAAQKNFRIVLTPDQAAVVAIGNGKGNHPLMGLYDLNAKREIFADRTISWTINARQNKKQFFFGSNLSPVRWNSTLNGNQLTVKWQGTEPFAYEAVTVLDFNGKRLETDATFRSLAADRVIEEVVYPEYNFARIPGKNDAIAHPYMSGIEVPNPTMERFKYGQTGRYPSGTATIQFGAYYGNNCGVYYGFEDGFGRTKTLEVSGKRGQLFVQWINKAGVKPGSKGGNTYTANGKAVLELYGSGRWYEAGKIYRKFAETAAWWIKDLPRKSSPAWFKENSLWLLCMSNTLESHEAMRDQAIALRKYFDMPIGIHWYGWDDSNDGLGWPHFPAKKFVADINKEIRAAGIYTIPYIDNRLWALKDGPKRASDYMYKSHGHKYAAKDLHGKIYTETYSKTAVYAIMCPAVKPWQDFMANLVIRLAKDGFDGVYHDQVATGAPRMCYDPTHGHYLNGGDVWLELGYWPMFDKMFKVLHKQYPNFCHTTEENAEVYLRQFDGYMVWRWTVPGQIPLFQSIYSGRAQFVGRLFDHSRRGDRQSFFSKVGQQLVNSEQIGWFTIRDISKPDAKRLYVKKTMYIRKALLSYFNTGRMLAPIQWKSMPLDKSKWGGNEALIVTMPKIANSAWQGADGSRMWLFTNTQELEDVTAVPQIKSSKGFWICREGADKPVFSKTAPAVSLKRNCSEVWIEGPKAVADKIQATMKKIASFDAGSDLPGLKFVMPTITKKVKGVSGKLYTAKDIVALSGVSKTENNSHVGWLEGDTFISFGEVDFGTKGAGTIAVRVTVDPNYAGGTLEIHCNAPGDSRKKVGTLTLRSTGGWNNYVEVPVKLNQRLTGKQNIIFYITGGPAACNFAGWRYLEN